MDDDIDMADLGSLDAPASSTATVAPSARFQPKVKGKPKPKPKPKPKEPEPNQEDVVPHAAVAAPLLPEDSSVDAMEMDGAGSASAVPGADEMDHEDEDFVVREIDVYFTPKPFDADTMLYIMQYPLRPCWRPYELNEICKEVRVKPCSSKVEVDLEINTESDNYDPEVSASLRLTKQTLSSSKTADATDYAIGVLQGNLVHLNHIDAVMQLRPSTSHLNSGGSHTRQPSQQARTNVGTGGPTVPSAKGNERSEDSKDCAEETEPWISLTYEPAGSDVATKYYTEMITNDGRPIDFTMSTSDYAMSLCPGGPTSSKNISRCQALREMLLLPLEGRLKKWFTEVSQVNRFDALIYLAPTYSEEDVLKILPAYADLVRGLWVCKSSLLYDDGHASKRDRIILEFTKKESIPMKYIDNLFRDERTRNKILSPLCKRREKLKDYKFIVAADSSFIKRYSHIVKEQEKAWSVREATISEPLGTCSTTEQSKTNNSARSNAPVKGPDPVMGKTRDDLVQGSENHARSVLDSVFTANKVRSFQAVVTDLRHLAAKYASDRKDGSRFQALSNAAKACATLPRNELHASIKVLAVPVHGVYVQKTEQKNTIRNVLIRFFLDREPNATLKKQEIIDYAEARFKRKISDKECHQAVTEICIVNDEGHLILKNGDKP